MKPPGWASEEVAGRRTAATTPLGKAGEEWRP